MAKLPGHNYQRDAVSDHQRGVSVPQTVDGHLWKAGPGDEIAKPLCNAVRENWGASIGGEHPAILILPGIPKLASLLILPLPILQQQ